MDDGEDEDMDDEDGYPNDEPYFPGGNLIWPCPSCAPGNNTGYVCVDPIPEPSAGEALAESQRLGRLLIAPRPHDLRPSIETAQVCVLFPFASNYHW